MGMQDELNTNDYSNGSDQRQASINCSAFLLQGIWWWMKKDEDPMKCEIIFNTAVTLDMPPTSLAHLMMQVLP